MKTVGIFADLPTASTGFAVVCRNLANELSRWFRVIYFGRFGLDKEFALDTSLSINDMFEYVPTQGGVWNRELVVRILKHYNEVDYVFCEDDWFSAEGIVGASNFWEKPMHLLTPIDSLPISSQAFNDVFTNCHKIYVPNKSYNNFNDKKRLSTSRCIESAGDRLSATFLPHGCRTDIFKPKKVPRDAEFTFVWIGRMEQRKNPKAFILAVEKIHEHIDARYFIRSDWNTPNAKKVLQYIMHKNLPITLDSMEDIPHEEMVDVYNRGDVFICSAKAGGFEMSINEAGACELPSLCTDWTFMNENVVHGKSGFVIPTAGFCHPPKPSPHEFRTSDIAYSRIWGNISVDALADKMLWCYHNQDVVKQMGRWARANVVQNYQWSTIAERLKYEILE